MAEQPQSGDGLVMPEAFPCKSENINVENVKSASAKLKSMGQTIDSKMDAIVGLWNGLPAVYVAPEAEQAYGLMAPAATASETIKTKFEKASGALDVFAEAIGPVKSELASLESEAATFRSNTLSTYGDKWRDHQEVVDRNNELLGRYAKIVETMTTAAATCATTINGLLDGVSLPAVEGISAEAIMKSGEIMPWGGAVEKNRNCAESVGHGVGNFAKNTWEGVQALFGRGADGSWSWENAGNTWLGIGDFAMSVWVVKNPLVAAGVTLLGGKEGAQWVADRYEVVATAAAGMVGFDLDAHLRGEDGFHKWKKDGIVSSVTESALNIVSARIPGAGPVKGVVAGTKLGAAAVKTLNLATRAADFAVPGGGWLIRGGVKVVDLGLEQIQKLRSKTRVDLTEAAGPVKPGPLTPGGHNSSGHGGGSPHTNTSSSSGGGGGVSRSSGPGPDFLAPRNPGGPRLNPFGMNLHANNPIAGGGGHTFPGNDPIGGHTGTGSGAGSGHAGTGGHSSGGGAGGSGQAGTSGGTGTGTGPGHGGGVGAGNGGHTGTGGSNAGGAHQPPTNPNGGSRPDPLLEKPRTRHDSEETPTTKNSREENPAGGKSPTRPAPKDPSTTRTGSDGGETPRARHGQENTGPSSRGNPHGHGGGSAPTGNENPARSADRSRHSPTEPVDPGHAPRPRNTTPETNPESKHNPEQPASPEQPDHPTGPEHPHRDDEGSSTGKNTSSDGSRLPDPPTVKTWDGREVPNTLRSGEARERFGVDYTDADVKRAYENAFDPVKGEHVDPRTGEPLVETTRDGRGRGWEMRYDPATKEWSAWNRGDGYGRAGKPLAFPEYDPAVGRTYSSGDGKAPGEPHPHTPPETHDRATGTPGVEHVNRGNTSGAENQKIENWLKYQEQITGWKRGGDGKIPEYTLYDSNGDPVRIDGRTWRGHPPQEVFLDAKRGYQILHHDPDHPKAKGMQQQLIDEAKRQSRVLPRGAKLEWHISSREAADAISRILEDARIYDVDVIYTPER
mgnify:FL=1